MDNVQTNRQLVCIKFPGIVKNDEKALQCLGGIRSISQVYSETTKKRLGISFQPENPYVKKIFADAHKCSGILLKVKVKKTKVNNEVKREVVATAVVGRVSVIYQFESMCDFQYLPIQEAEGSKKQCMLEQLFPSGMDSLSFLYEPASPFILPPHFTRSDRPMSYLYTFKKYPERKDEAETDDVHRRRRSDRALPGRLFTFNLVDDLAAAPHDYYIKQKEERQRVYPLLEKEYALVAKHFEDRPLWTMNLLKYETKIRMPSLKVILPCLAIQMKDGPWKMCWVKYGYDPRKEPAARIYQTLDFRLRSTPGLHTMVLTRDKTIHKLKKTDRVRPLKRRHNHDESYTDDSVPEGAVHFRPGMVPAQRQIYYQRLPGCILSNGGSKPRHRSKTAFMKMRKQTDLTKPDANAPKFCDIQIPEVQELISVEPPPGYLCHPKRGWLPPNTDETCRDFLYKYVQEALKSSYYAELKLEQGSSDDDNSEDDASTAAAAEADEADKIT